MTKRLCFNNIISERYAQQFPISMLCGIEILLLKSILAAVCKYFCFKCECEILTGGENARGLFQQKISLQKYKNILQQVFFCF